MRATMIMLIASAIILIAFASCGAVAEPAANNVGALPTARRLLSERPRRRRLGQPKCDAGGDDKGCGKKMH